MPHLLRHGTFVLKGISERPVILSFECCALGEEAIITYFTGLRLDTFEVRLSCVWKTKILDNPNSKKNDTFILAMTSKMHQMPASVF